MLKNKTMNYKIMRPTLWYVKGEVYSKDEMRRHFTENAFDQLIEYGYIEIVDGVKFNSQEEEKFIWGESKKKFLDHLNNLTPQEIEEHFPKDDRPKGWISINDSLPDFLVKDFIQGYTAYKCKFANGNEVTISVSDPMAFFVEANYYGITHWFND